MVAVLQSTGEDAKHEQRHCGRKEARVWGKIRKAAQNGPQPLHSPNVKCASVIADICI